MKVLLIDPVGNGHHREYAMLLANGLKELGGQVYFFGATELLKLLSSTPIIQGGVSFKEKVYGSNLITNEVARTKLHYQSILFSQKINANICHYLYMDHFLISSMINGMIHSMKHPLCGTIHWLYFLENYAAGKLHRFKGQLDLAALHYLTTHGMRMMVHSSEVAITLAKVTNTSQFDYVPYPVKKYNISDTERAAMRLQLRNQLALAPKDVLLLAFGDTRFDKGADLSLKMLSLLPVQYHLLFAGDPTYFSRAYLEEMAVNYGIGKRLHFDPRVIPEDEMSYYFCGCDILLLPYRKIFSGQSGPLTVAAGFFTKVVAPDLPILAETVKKNSLGWLYPVENVELMASAVQEAANSPVLNYPEKFLQAHSPTAFVDAVIKSYSTVLMNSIT